MWEAIAAKPTETLAALPRAAGQIDLRGVRREPWTDPVLQIGRVRFESVDFSRGRLAGLRFSHCIFQDCIFDDTDLDECRSWGSVFRACSFRRARLGNAGAGGGKIPNTYDGCEFHRADLRGSSQSGARYRATRFVDCRLTRVDFDGVWFEDVSFTGPMDEVRFDAFPLGTGSLRRWLSKPAPLALDMSRAVPRWCEFVGHDLSASSPPRGVEVITYPRRREVAARVLARLGEEPELTMLKIVMEREVEGAPRRAGGGPGFRTVSELGDTNAERVAAARLLRSVLEGP